MQHLARKAGFTVKASPDVRGVVLLEKILDAPAAGAPCGEAAASTLAALATPLFAHHGSVAYDNSHAVVLKQATVTKVNWANPHILVLFDAKDSKGVMRHWAVEGGGPSAVNASGWTKDAVQPGDTTHIIMSSIGIELSTDGGKTWSPALKSTTMFGPIAWASGSSGVAYAAGFDGSVWKTTDSGKTWTPAT